MIEVSERATCFQRVVSLFSLCYLLLEKSSKSLIPLGDCPFVLNRLPDFLGKSPCFQAEAGFDVAVGPILPCTDGQSTSAPPG
jgi:hypothetical protein